MCMAVVVAAATPARAAPDDALELMPIESVTASSTLADKDGAWAPARALDETAPDGTLAGGWCEGKPDAGIGETLTITFATPTRVKMLYVATWRPTSIGANRNNFITAVQVCIDDRPWQNVEVGMAFPGSLGIDAVVRVLAIKIAGVKRGKDNNSCLHVDVHTEPRRTLVVGAGAGHASSLRAAIARLARERQIAPPATVKIADGVDHQPIQIGPCAGKCPTWHMAPAAGGWRVVKIE
jgi:hypothetical protein